MFAFTHVTYFPLLRLIILNFIHLSFPLQFGHFVVMPLAVLVPFVSLWINKHPTFTAESKSSIKFWYFLIVYVNTIVTLSLFKSQWKKHFHYLITVINLLLTKFGSNLGSNDFSNMISDSVLI